MTSSSRTFRRPRITPLVEFLNTEAGGGVLLLVATVAALVWANSAWSASYEDLWHTALQIGPDAWELDLDLHHWVNDGLMTIFFFLIGLEIKRELTVGELRDPRAALLPAIAAFGGMAAPALVFLAISGGGDHRSGWGIPMATDIAFAVGALALLGSRVPAGLKLFLLTLAIVDDIGAIAVIALFYAGDLEVAWLLVATAALAVIPIMRIARVSAPLAYVPIAIVAWYATFRGGVHPTIAGVALGLITPATEFADRPVLEQLEHRLHPWSSYVVVPLFALANAGVELTGGLGDALTSRLTLAVAAGLVVGKTVGISGATYAALATRATRLPVGVDRRHVLGAGALGGVGFTVALFIASLAFTDESLQSDAKVGILTGSLISGVLGAAVLTVGSDRQPVRAGRADAGEA